MIVAIVLGAVLTANAEAGEGARLIEVERIWERAPHNAFTDLIRFEGRWLCTFREGSGHVSPDGAIRVIASDDGEGWESIALLTSEVADLRDPKLSIMPDGRLMLNAAEAFHEPGIDGSHQSIAWFSEDGASWDGPEPIGDRGDWLWHVSWGGATPFAVGYPVGGNPSSSGARLYRGVDGRLDAFEVFVKEFRAQGQPNEATIRFLPDQTALCLLRRDGVPSSAQLGRSRPPYKQWSWQDLGVQIGGPEFLRLPDGRLFATVRLYDGGPRTAVCRLDPEAGTLREVLALPSGGDTSYAGMAWHEGMLWISYYSSHEAKTAIYLARVEPPPTE